MKRPYLVEAEVVSSHQFFIEEASTPEEAEAIVEMFLEDGELGTVTNRVIEAVEAVPAEAGIEGDYQPVEEIELDEEITI